MGNRKTKKNKRNSKLNEKKSNAFVPVNPVKPPKKKQTDFKSEDATEKENVIGMSLEFAKTVGLYILTFIMFLYGGKMIYDGITDNGHSIDLGAFKVSTSFVGLILFVLGAFLLWNYKSNTTIKRNKK